MSEMNENVLPLFRTIPYQPQVVTYTVFGQEYEPNEFTNWLDESMSWKDSCYIGDWSTLAKIRLKGPDAKKFLMRYCCASFEKFAVGQAKHSVFCNKNGYIIGEGIIMRLDEDEYYFTGGPGVMYMIWRSMTVGKDYDMQAFTEEKDERSIIQIQGPKSLAVMEEFVGQPLRDIPFMHFKKYIVDGMEFNLLRQGMSGSIGFELHGFVKDGKRTFQRILDIGEKYGICGLGGRTKMVNHVEACYPTPSVDYIPAAYDPDDEDMAAFCGLMRQIGVYDYMQNRHGSAARKDSPENLYFTPYDWGWGKVVKFDHDFLGREALEKLAQNPPRGVCTLVWNEEDVLDVYASYFRKGEAYKFMEMPRELLGDVVADKVMVGDKEVGVTTSRCYSYYFREMLSLCSLDKEYLEPGTQVEIIWGDEGTKQKRIRATVQKAPYKRDDRRLDLTKL